MAQSKKNGIQFPKIFGIHGCFGNDFQSNFTKIGKSNLIVDQSFVSL